VYSSSGKRHFAQIADRQLQANPVNGPFDDPGVIVSLTDDNRFILFDAGEMPALPPSDIYKISHIFISHTHMDHFSGFDRILRLLLGRQKKLFLFGPEGFLQNISAKLNAYCWNLSNTYTDHLQLCVHEIRKDRTIRQDFSSKNGFSASTDSTTEIGRSKVIWRDSHFSVSCAILDHKIPVLGYAIREEDRIKIRKNALHALDLKPGPWVQKFIATYLQEGASSSLIRVDTSNGQNFKIRAQDLFDRIAKSVTGKKFSYITDVAYHSANRKKMVELAEKSNHLFIEAAFLKTDNTLAANKCHLTAHQAGTIAGLARANHYSIFHFSKRYRLQESKLYQEAERAYMMTLNKSQPEEQL